MLTAPLKTLLWQHNYSKIENWNCDDKYLIFHNQPMIIIHYKHKYLFSLAIFFFIIVSWKV